MDAVIVSIDWQLPPYFFANSKSDDCRLFPDVNCRRSASKPSLDKQQSIIRLGLLEIHCGLFLFAMFIKSFFIWLPFLPIWPPKMAAGDMDHLWLVRIGLWVIEDCRGSIDSLSGRTRYVTLIFFFFKWDFQRIEVIRFKYNLSLKELSSNKKKITIKSIAIKFKYSYNEW